MSIPMSGPDVLERYFLEMRAKVLELAASLDRFDRAGGSGTSDSDVRVGRLRKAIRALLEAGPGRAEKVQQIFSRDYDPNWRSRPSV